MYVDELERKSSGGKFPFLGVEVAVIAEATFLLTRFTACRLSRLSLSHERAARKGPVSPGSSVMRWTACVVAHESRGLPL